MPTGAGLLASIAVPAAAAGWLLNEATGRWRDRRMASAPLARAVAELLDFRFRIISTSVLTDEISRLAGSENLGDRAVRAAVAMHMGDPTEALRRYHAAVVTIADFDPVLSYRLRTLIDPESVFAESRAAIGRHAGESAAYHVIEDGMVVTVIDRLREMILDAARRHSWRTARRTRDALALQDDAESTRRELRQRLGALARTLGFNAPAVEQQRSRARTA